MKRILSGVFGLATLAAAAWMVWWFIGAEGQRTAFEMWLENQRERGWQAEAAKVEMSGFPGAFQLAVTDLKLSDPRNGWAWSAPTLNAESSAAAPTRIAVDWPSTQTLGTTQDNVTIEASPLKTLLDLRPGPSMELREAATDVKELTITSRSGWVGGANTVELNIIEKPEDLAPPNSYDFRGAALDVKIPRELLDNLDPTGLLEPTVEKITLTGHAAFDDPIDRSTVEESQLAVRAATIREAGFAWDDMMLVLKGSFRVDDAGYPVGKLEVEAREWRKIVQVAARSGAIGPDLAETIIGAVEFVTALSGGGPNLKVPLSLSEGAIRIGPLAIASAPRLAPPR